MGLSAALADSDPRLTDGSTGPYTNSALVRLCRLISPSADFHGVEKTISAANHYGALAKASPDWAQVLRGQEFQDNIRMDALAGASFLPLRLAGALEVKGTVFWF